MTKTEALAMHENKEAVQRAKRIEFMFDTDPQATGYVREKAGEVNNMFGDWFMR